MQIMPTETLNTLLGMMKMVLGKKKKKENGSRNNNKGRGKMEMLAVSALSTRDSTSQGQFKNIRLYHESKKTYIRRSGKFSMEHLKQTYGYESRDGG